MRSTGLAVGQQASVGSVISPCRTAALCLQRRLVAPGGGDKDGWSGSLPTLRLLVNPSIDSGQQVCCGWISLFLAAHSETNATMQKSLLSQLVRIGGAPYKYAPIQAQCSQHWRPTLTAVHSSLPALQAGDGPSTTTSCLVWALMSIVQAERAEPHCWNHRMIARDNFIFWLTLFLRVPKPITVAISQ